MVSVDAGGRGRARGRVDELAPLGVGELDGPRAVGRRRRRRATTAATVLRRAGARVAAQQQPVPVARQHGSLGRGAPQRARPPSRGRSSVGVVRVHDLGVGQHRVDLPRLAVGAVHPHLVLDGVATGGLVLDGGGEPVGLQAGARRRPTSGRVSTSTPRWFRVPASPRPR